MTITADVHLFDTALRVTCDDPEALLVVWDHPPAWTYGYEFQSEREVWLWLTRVPSADEIAAWTESVETVVTVVTAHAATAR